MHEFGYERSLLNGIPCSLIKREVVVESECEVEENIVFAGEEAFQLLDDANAQLDDSMRTIWSLYSLITDNLRRKPRLTMRRWKSLR